MLFTLRKHKPVLLCPGPVKLSKLVKRAVVETEIGHREPEFSALLSECTEMIKPIVGLDSHETKYEVVFTTGSGTAANEMVLSSFGAEGPVLVITNGEFGERLYEVVRLHNSKVDQLRFDWQEKINLKLVEKTLRSKKYSLVAMVHHETSTGLLNPIEKVSKLAHAHGALISVDAVSSIGAEKIELQRWNIDIMTGASGKALSAMPGVGIILVKNAITKQLNDKTRKSHYLDLHKHLSFKKNHTQTPNTPAVHVFVSLHASLQEITKQGIESFRVSIQERARLTRDFLSGIGLTYTDYGIETSHVITCVAMPVGLEFNFLNKSLKEKGIIIYNGKGVLKNKIFQIGHIGALSKSDVTYALKVIKMVVKTSENSAPTVYDLRKGKQLKHGV
jgi:2-aminoethylphosphonate-pyruvate transaminase